MRVAVLGGGLAGLSAGLTLRRAGIEAVVFEAAAAPGGKVATVVRDGFLFEDGPNSLTAQSHLSSTLVHELGLEPLPVRPPRTRFVVRRGRLRRAPSLGMVSAGGALRALLEPFFARRAGVTADAESLQVFLERHFGSETGTLLANVLASGVYAGDPQRLSAADAFPRIASLARVGALGSVILGAVGQSLGARRASGQGVQAGRSLWTLREGLGTLPVALAGALGSALRLGAPVQAIEPEGRGWRVSVATRDGDERFDALVCALPSRVAADLLAPIAPAAAKELRQIRYASLTVVHLGVRLSDLRVRPRGFGLLDGEGKLNLLGTLFPSSLFPGRAPEGHVLLTSLVGGVRHPELFALADEQVTALVREDLGKLLGLGGTPVISRVHRWAEAVPQYELGHAARVLAAEQAVTALPPIQLAGAAYHGVSVELALQGGAAAARRLLVA